MSNPCIRKLDDLDSVAMKQQQGLPAASTDEPVVVGRDPKPKKRRGISFKQVATETTILLRRFQMDLPMSSECEDVLLPDWECVTGYDGLVALDTMTAKTEMSTGGVSLKKDALVQGIRTYDEDETWYMDCGYEGNPFGPVSAPGTSPCTSPGPGFRFEKGYFDPESARLAAAFRSAARRIVALLAVA